MRLTKQTNYALRMLMYCESSGELVPVVSIAKFYDLSEQSLLKILQVLTKGGFVEAVLSCPLVANCGLNQALHEALDAFFKVLDGYTLADLTNRERNLHVLLRLDAAKNLPLDS